MKAKLTYPPPIFAANHVVTIRTFAISLPVPGRMQVTARMSPARPSVTDSQTFGSSGAFPSPSLRQTTVLNQPIQYWKPSAVGVNTALPQPATHVGVGTASASIVAKRRYIDASSKAFAKYTNAESTFVKVKVPKPLLGVPGKITERTTEVSSKPGLKSAHLDKTTNPNRDGPEASRSTPMSSSAMPAQSRPTTQRLEKLKSVSSSLKRKRNNSDLESTSTAPNDSSQPLTNTLENGTKRCRQSTGPGPDLVCPNCGKQ
ncbi:hypothetical protein C0995_007504 [Termitomyces sp. Mi166|nr:hypothetical protein C0995_007504 [Termitomyces sp. Mi166\